MNDWQEMVLEELKALNRKLERMDQKFNDDLDPIKSHVSRVQFVGLLISIAIPIGISVLALFM